MKKLLFAIILISIILISGCSNYLTDYKVDEDHYIRIPENEDERREYCQSFCSKYTHDPCLGECSGGEVTESVLTSYKETYGLLTTEEEIEVCISRYITREGDLPSYTDIETRCTVCEGSLNCPKLENEYVLNQTTWQFEKKE